MRNVQLSEVDGVERDVLAIATDYSPGFLLDWHEHRRAQFLYGATGTMIVDTGDGTWTVPTAQGVMIPPATRHRVRMLDANTSSLYIEPVAVPWWPSSCVVVEVSSLLRELLLVAADLPAAYDRGGRDGAIAALLLFELSTLGSLPLHLTLPASPDLVALCRDYLGTPEAGVTNADWAGRVAMSERAFTRKFVRETGISPAACSVAGGHPDVALATGDPGRDEPRVCVAGRVLVRVQPRVRHVTIRRGPPRRQISSSVNYCVT